MTQLSGFDVVEFLDDYKQSRENIEKEIIEIIYFMEGSLQYQEAWETTYDNRKIIADVVKKLIEKKQKQNPFG